MADLDRPPTDAELEVTRDKISFARLIAIIFGVLAGLVLVTFPLAAIREIFEVIAGKDTQFDFNLGIGISIVVTLSIPAFAGYKLYAQGRELVRLRDRISRLEGQIRKAGGRPVR